MSAARPSADAERARAALPPLSDRKVDRVLLVALLALYAALLLPTLARQGIGWDELIDREIARSYSAGIDGWLSGSEIDPSQTRLPMAAVALLWKVSGRSDLLTARFATVLAGAAAIAAAYAWARPRLGRASAALACALLATSPFFLSFARVAFTESDVFLAAALAWLVVAAERWRAQPCVGRAAAVGMLFGLCLSAKFTSLALIPALVWVFLSGARSSTASTPPSARALYVWSAWSLLWAAGGLVLAAGASDYGGTLRAVHVAATAAAWLAVVLWSSRRRRDPTGGAAAGAFAGALALLTFLLTPPEHLTNAGILRGLARRFTGEMGEEPAFALEAAALHALSILFKSSPLIGAWLLIGPIAALASWKRTPAQLPALVVVSYFAGISALPLVQTFYAVPLLPWLCVLAVAAAAPLHARRPALVRAGAGLAVVLLAVDLVRCTPDFNLNGYQWLGRRAIAGRPSLGYRSIVQVPSDGVEQAITWLNEHAGPGDRVLAFVQPWHIAESTASNPAYAIAHGFHDVPFDDPEFVVVDLNSLIAQDANFYGPTDESFELPYDPGLLAQRYDKVFAVTRAFGIEVASVWRRREPSGQR